jgi:holo-[acyl-carrier protein] synthase
VIGVDVVDVARLRRALERSPGLEDRLFTTSERAHCARSRDRVERLAGTLAAKEAVIKALRLGSLPAWGRRIEITRDRDGAPRATVGGRMVEVSISHDGGVAVAVALAGGSGAQR